jgi:hypothetical protein
MVATAPVNQYPLGNTIRVSSTFTNLVGGAFVDPTTVQCNIRDPTGKLQVFTATNGVVKDTVGQYHLDINPSFVGIWYYKWYGTGANLASGDSKFIMYESPAD